MTTSTPEPPDHYVYQWVSFNRDTFEFFLSAVAFYESLLEQDLKSLGEDEDLRAILGTQALNSYPITRELERVRRLHRWFNEKIENGGSDAWDYDVDISHSAVRFIRSAVDLYLEHLRRRRDLVASRAHTSKSLLEAVDQQLARFEEKTQLGVFQNATPYPLLLSQLAEVPQERPADTAAGTTPSVGTRPRPVILETIEIRDPELRKRCLDLLAQFREDGQNDRLDTVVNEATRILEDRLRALSAAPATCVGVDLARHALASAAPRLIVSDVAPEQEAAHLLYRGVFGFIRNSVHHRIVATLQPERVLQIVGMVDYLISVAEAARRHMDDAGEPIV